MSEGKQKSRRNKKSGALKRLAEDLASLTQDVALPEPTGDEDMLSLIVEEANNGIDIASRYPTFYKKLLNHPELMEAFLDILDSIEDDDTNQMIPWASATPINLDFVPSPSPRPTIERLAEIWRIHWRQTIEQLQAIFSESAPAYRSDPGASEDLWFILLRDEVDLDGSLYSVALECTFSDQQQHALTPFLNIAVTVSKITKQTAFPIEVSLQWGTYIATIQIAEESRTKFPDIPLPAMFDKEFENVNAELNLTIEPVT